LLLCVFIMMYGFSKINEDKFNILFRSIHDKMNYPKIWDSKEKSINPQAGEEIREYPGKLPGKTVGEEEYDHDADLYAMEIKLNHVLTEGGYRKAVIVKMEERGLAIQMLTDKLLFDRGEASLKPECKKILDSFSKILLENNRPLRVEGNTCNIPIKSERFADNWELSTMRATNVAKYLITRHGVDPEKVSIVGYGEYRPMFKNTGEENRSKNRRVDIVILKSGKTGHHGRKDFALSEQEGKDFFKLTFPIK
jgi:chemotaxis protein MotB